MAYSDNSFEEDMKEKIQTYSFDSLFNMKVIHAYTKQLEELYGLGLTLTKEKTLENMEIYIGESLYCYLNITNERKVDKSYQECEKAIQTFISLIEEWGSQSFYANEYKKELELEKVKNGSVEDKERKDSLTGVYSKTYFSTRLQVLDRAEVAPVALIQGNINDWKFVYDRYGINESDRLITIVSQMLQNHSKCEYLIGRWDGDVFNIVIPMPEPGEAEQYIDAVTKEAEAFEDEILAPSIAFGIAYKENVEEALIDKVSDAEYEMFNHKLQQKSMPGYQERLEKGSKSNIK